MTDRDPLAPLLAALRAVVEWFEQAHAPGAIIGGVAASVLGRPRATRDVDVLTRLPESEWSAFLDLGRHLDFEPRRHDALDFAREARVLLVRHGASGIDVDIVLAGLPFEDEVIRRRLAIPVGDIIVPFATPEDVLIMKAVARRPRDFADIEAIVTAQDDLDLDRVRIWVREFSQALAMPDLLTDFEQTLARAKSGRR